MAQKFKAEHIKIQHHLAHIFSAIGEKYIPNSFIGIACDGTGYGLDGKIWGGEVFKISNLKIDRIGHLENQIMIGGDLAVKEPARMLIGILSKFLNKKEVYNRVKKYYSKNKFEVLHNQFLQNFNCQETSSTGRILDAVSLLLGFCQNQRNYKHEPIGLLEKNSATPYLGIKPKIKKVATGCCLPTTYLFEYLIKNLNKDKKRLAATAQLYIAEGLYEISQKSKNNPLNGGQIFFAGGIANNKIISHYLKSKGAFISQKIPPGDAGISFGQIIYFLLANPRN